MTYEESIDFGFLFCRVVAFYSISDKAILEMPVKRFWLLSQCLDRIEAQRAVRNLTVASAAQGDPKLLRDQLVREIGTVSTGVSERDEQGFAGLKALSQNN